MFEEANQEDTQQGNQNWQQNNQSRFSQNQSRFSQEQQQNAGQNQPVFSHRGPQYGGPPRNSSDDLKLGGQVRTRGCALKPSTSGYCGQNEQLAMELQIECVFWYQQMDAKSGSKNEK